VRLVTPESESSAMSHRILIVDDEPSITGFCHRLVERLGFETRLADSGEAALEILEQESIDLLLADIVMPGISGVELLVAARARVPDMAAILMTGHGDIALVIEALRAGADDFLLKPFGAGDLAGAIDRALARVRAAQGRLLRQERLAVIRELGASIAHELRNPLGVIGNSTYYLQARLGASDPRIARHLDLIAREVQVANGIIADLMRSVDARELRAVPTDPNALVRAATEDAALPTSVVVHLDLAPDLPRVNLDPDGMHQVFQNLIDNAAQAMPDGGRLTITSRVEHGQVHITFSDTGTGIAPEATQSVFDPLYTTKAKGFGLGLSIVQLLVEAHGGEVTVSSQLGAGSCFSVILPANEPPPA
jgi:signal transduction histidine kinase